MIVIDNNAIHIVDSVMGTGKTQACIAWMRQHPEQKYLYVTPYLDECSRIQASAPELDFQQPQENKTKSADLLRLLSEGKNITTTHELLPRFVYPSISRGTRPARCRAAQEVRKPGIKRKLQKKLCESKNYDLSEREKSPLTGFLFSKSIESFC